MEQIEGKIKVVNGKVKIGQRNLLNPFLVSKNVIWLNAKWHNGRDAGKATNGQTLNGSGNRFWRNLGAAYALSNSSYSYVIDGGVEYIQANATVNIGVFVSYQTITISAKIKAPAFPSQNDGIIFGVATSGTPNDRIHAALTISTTGQVGLICNPTSVVGAEVTVYSDFVIKINEIFTITVNANYTTGVILFFVNGVKNQKTVTTHTVGGSGNLRHFNKRSKVTSDTLVSISNLKIITLNTQSSNLTEAQVLKLHNYLLTER